jgi:hypothetical protein
MNKSRTFLIFSLFLLTSGVRTAKDKPSGLMTEFIREPAGVAILDLKPEFSWIVQDDAIRQTAYRILVASSKKKLEEGNADVWDSGKIAGNSSTELECGCGLKENTGYYWKVKIWDEKDRPSGYSEIQAFRTGNPVKYLTTKNKFLSTKVSPTKFVRTGDGHYFIDFGKDAFGTITLDILPVAEDTIIIHLGEKLSDHHHIDRNPGGSIRYQKILLPVKPGIRHYRAELLKDSRNTGPAAVKLPDSLGIITPFRYCEVEHCTFSLNSSSVKQIVNSYFFDDAESSFSSSDTTLNRIWELCRYSMKATSFAGIYVDGDRERIPYEADAYINQLGHYYSDREYSMARLTNEYFIDHPTWPTEWILQTVPMFYNDFMFTGNIESVKNYYNKLKSKTLMSLAGKDGLISVRNCTPEIMAGIGFSNRKERLRDIVDWPPSQKDTGWKLVSPEGERDGYDMVEVNTVVNAFYYHGLVCMAELASAVGSSDDSEFFKKEAARVKTVFNAKLLDPNTLIYIDGVSSKHSSLHANMMALAFGLVPDENRKAVVDFIKTRGMACSVYGAQYLLEGLYRAGEGDYAFQLLTATNDRSWWNMIRSGSTITMEAWDMKYKPNSDWNHAWGAAPANIIPGAMWGISPALPGFAKAIIRPQLGELEHCSISVPTIRGDIFAGYRASGNSKEYKIKIPANMECDFLLNGLKGTTFKLNGRNMHSFDGIVKLGPGLNKIVI